MTNLLEQYEQMKSKHPDAILLFRVGDFYETFKADAVDSSQILGITLTRRQTGNGAIELAGFPHHALDTYLPKIVRAGRRVAICEPLENPKFTKRGVDNNSNNHKNQNAMITETITPAVAASATANNADNKFFDFEKARVQVLTLDQLERTHKENDVYGNPLKGVYHFALLQQLIAMCEEFNYGVEVYDLFAAQNKDRNTPGVVLLPQVEASFGERAIEAHILRRVFANIRLTDFDDAENTTNLAVAFHQKGIQVGFGNMVKICHNQCMLSPTNYVATYSEKGRGRGEGVPVAEVIDTVRSWLLDARQIIVTEREKIERMKNIDVDADTIFRLIGLLTALRVKCDTRHSSIRTTTTYPLNQSQISQFTESLLLKYHDEHNITAWDMYNAATDLYKATSMDIPALLPQNRAMVSFLDEQFQLN